MEKEPTKKSTGRLFVSFWCCFPPGRTLDKTKLDAPHRRRLLLRGLWRRKKDKEREKNQGGEVKNLAGGAAPVQILMSC